MYSIYYLLQYIVSEFKVRVLEIIDKIPYGKVVSYGQVAVYAGIPRGARQVGWILNQSKPGSEIAWWRVINNEGRISIKNKNLHAEDQKRYLVSEGIKVGDNYEIDIEKYRFKPDKKFIKSLKLSDRYLKSLSQKLPYEKFFY